ncbi:MAG: hypothetical protein QOE14_437, partial [Humisphaera sp.]|nr:hypothetical protein [Humisphaera sp.]
MLSVEGVVGVTGVESLERRLLLASGPIVITKGGTYTGSWENLLDRNPVITVKTTEPVVIQNATIKGKGNLIYSATAGANITVRNSSGVGVNPNVAGASPGRFITVEGAKNLVVDNNYLESTGGIHVLGYGGNRTTAQTIKVTNNRAKNIDGRQSNGAGGWMDFNVRTNVTTGVAERGFNYAQFLQLDK